VFDQSYIQYLTRFSFLATERPVAYLESAGGETAAFVPEFEVARVEEEAAFSRVASYPEYPGEEHPLRILARVLAEMGITGNIAADHDGYPGILGYSGPALSAVTGATIVPLAGALEQLMRRKSEAELELIRESGRWCAHAHRLLQTYTRPGVTEAQAGLRAGYEASLAMLDALGPDYDGQLSSTDGASAGYRGQIGVRSAWAHAVSHNIEFTAGDLLVTETSAPVWGYNAELERAMVVGPPTDEMRRHFEHMRAAQQVAFDVVRPGVTCAAVDRAVLSYFEEQGILDTWSQHTGHAIGLRNHEAPFLDVGDETVIEPGMVFTIEPGVYVAGLGGFRHSDTVAVTPDGIELLTDYPSDIESLRSRPELRLGRRRCSYVPFAGEQTRKHVVEEPQRHAPEDVALDVDPVHEQGLLEADRREGQRRARRRVGEDAHRRRQHAHDLRLLQPPGRVGRDAAEERVHAPAGRAGLERRQCGEHVDVVRAEPDLFLGLAECGREEIGVAGLGLPAREPELPAVETAVVCAHDDGDAQLAVCIAEDRDQDGGIPQPRAPARRGPTLHSPRGGTSAASC
jgi:Xaa-Pro aminopeptidase